MPLPEYTVRESAKAKSLRLRVTPAEGLTVIVPRGFDVKQLPAILKKKKVWIDDALTKARHRRRFLEPKAPPHLPERLTLRAIGEVWPINYRWDNRRAGVSLRAENGELVFRGTEPERRVVIEKLKDWLRGRVRDSLFPQAISLAAKKGMTVGTLFVKSQRTRWASCSAKRNLTLNTKLLFLEPNLVRYVLVHELCHTVHLDHSKEFWRLVGSHEPRYRALDATLRNAWKAIPRWLFSQE